MKLSFALNSSKKAGPSKAAPSASSLRKPAAFAALEDDEPLDAAPTASSSNALDVNRRLAAQNVTTSTFGGSLSRAQKQKLAKEKEVDPTVFEYDEVYDQMKEAQIKAKQVKEDDPEVRKVCYPVSPLLEWPTHISILLTFTRAPTSRNISTIC